MVIRFFSSMEWRNSPA